jgi:uncharacterized membrane protein YphA (DoxX/SURF4 family)
MPRSRALPPIGRNVYGLAAVALGVIGLAWRHSNFWRGLWLLEKVPHREGLQCVVAAIEILGGILIQWRRTARAGAAVLGAIFLAFSLLLLHNIAADPGTYNGWGNFFLRFSLVCAALIVYGTARPDFGRPETTSRIGYVGFGICVVSFAIYQCTGFAFTVSLVPEWLPPGQKFWAVATTIAFALAAIALLTGRSALLASRLLTAMLLGFGLLVWLPRQIAHPEMLGVWTESAENFAIMGVAWVVADHLAERGGFPRGSAMKRSV